MASGTTRAALSRALAWIVDERMFAGLALHGNTRWTTRTLVHVALVWAWIEGGLVERFDSARRALAGTAGVGATTYQGFAKALRRWSEPLFAELVPRLRERMDELATLLGGRLVIAVDGTRVEAPRTLENERAFAEPRRSGRCRATGRDRRRSPRPQAWLTVLWHVGLGLPWAWRQGPSASSERDHLREMIGELPNESLLVADAGFQGYDLWRTLLEAGHDLLIRVGSNVRLLRTTGLVRTRDDLVLLWPGRVRSAGEPPLVLRRITLQGPRHPIHLVTTLLDRSAFPDAEAADLYRRRWGVETFVRTFKQTFGRGRLRSGSPENARNELAWSLVALWCLQLVGVRELIAEGLDPTRLGTANALRAIRAALLLLAATTLVNPLSGLPSLADDGWTRRCKSTRDGLRRKPPDPTARPPKLRFGDFDLEELQLVRDQLP